MADSLVFDIKVNDNLSWTELNEKYNLDKRRDELMERLRSERPYENVGVNFTYNEATDTIEYNFIDKQSAEERSKLITSEQLRLEQELKDCEEALNKQGIKIIFIDQSNPNQKLVYTIPKKHDDDTLCLIKVIEYGRHIVTLERPYSMIEELRNNKDHKFWIELRS